MRSRLSVTDAENDAAECVESSVPVSPGSVLPEIRKFKDHLDAGRLCVEGSLAGRNLGESNRGVSGTFVPSRGGTRNSQRYGREKRERAACAGGALSFVPRDTV